MRFINSASLLCCLGVFLGCDCSRQPAPKPVPVPLVFASDKESPETKSSLLTCRLEFLPVRNGSCVFTPMKAEALKSTFPGQEVLPQIWLRNTTDEVLKVPFEFDVRLQVVGPDGNLMTGTEVAVKPTPKGERTIAPGREERFGYDCEYRHGLLRDRERQFDLTKPGSYFVRAVVTSTADAETPNELWTGTVQSAPVAVAIRQIEFGPEGNGLQLGLVSYQPNEGGLPLGVVLRNNGSQPAQPTWDGNNMLHLTITGRDGKPVRDDFPTVCGPPRDITLHPGEVYCHAHELDWPAIPDDKPGELTVSLTLLVSLASVPGEPPISLKSNQLKLSRPKARR